MANDVTMLKFLPSSFFIFGGEVCGRIARGLTIICDFRLTFSLISCDLRLDQSLVALLDGLIPKNNTWLRKLNNLVVLALDKRPFQKEVLSLF